MGAMEMLPPRPGIYILMLALFKPRRITVGRLGTLQFFPGWYAYVGSAMGPGGVAARVGRHLKIRKKAHWHIDYLRVSAQLIGVFWTADTRVKEHLWASRLRRMPFFGEPVKGFGCSDCKCDAHLFHFRQQPDPLLVSRHLKARWNEMTAV
jgi:Uri superfamily endonuclease